MATRMRTIHRWPANELASFVELLREIRRFPEPRNALILADDRRMLALELSEDVSGEWQRVKSHPLWPKLSRDQEFKALWRAFQTNQRRSRRTILPRDEFRFLYNVIQGALFFVNWKQTVPSADSRKAAIRHVRELRRLHSKGVTLGDPTDDSILAGLLYRLEGEIQSVRRKVHEHPKFRESQTISRVAHALEVEVNGTSGRVLTRFAEFAGVDLDEGTIEKILKNSREHRGKFLEKLLATDIPPD